MKRRLVSGIMVTLLLTGMLTVAFEVQQVKASNVVSPYIAVVPARTVDPALTPGMNYTISIYTDYNDSDVWGYCFSLTFNPTVLEGIEVFNGDLITEDIAPTMFQSHGFDNTAGWLRYTTNGFFSLIKPYPLTSGPGTLANVTFRVIAKGTSNITLEDQGMHGEHALRTRLIGYTDGGWGDFYNIIDSATMPDHIQHGYFENVLCMHADWSRTYGGTTGEEGECFVETVDGGYALAGRTNYFGAGTNDFWLVKVDSSGNHEWNRTYGGGNGDVARSVVQTSDGGYALAGTTYSFGAGGCDFWLIKIALTTVAGDVNGDGTVDASDLSELSNAYISTPRDPNCDLNGDGKVTIQDLYILSKNYGKTAV